MIKYSVEWHFSRRVVVKIKYNRFVQVGNIEIVGFSIGSSEVKEMCRLRTKIDLCGCLDEKSVFLL